MQPVETSAKVDALLEWLLNSAKQTTDFVVEQAPGVAQEIVAYGRAMNTAGAIVGLAGVIVTLYWLRALIRKDVNWHDEYAPLPHMAWCGMALTSAVLLFGFGKGALMAWFAPRLYVIQWVSDRIAGR